MRLSIAFSALLAAMGAAQAQTTVKLANPYDPAVSGLLAAAVNTTRVSNPGALPVTQVPVGVSATGSTVLTSPMLGLSLPVGVNGASVNVNVPMPAATISRPANPMPSTRDGSYSPVTDKAKDPSLAQPAAIKRSDIPNWPVIK